jgi:hypothetical protein
MRHPLKYLCQFHKQQQAAQSEESKSGMGDIVLISKIPIEEE